MCVCLLARESCEEKMHALARLPAHGHLPRITSLPLPLADGYATPIVFDDWAGGPPATLSPAYERAEFDVIEGLDPPDDDTIISTDMFDATNAYDEERQLKPPAPRNRISYQHSLRITEAKQLITDTTILLGYEDVQGRRYLSPCSDYQGVLTNIPATRAKKEFTCSLSANFWHQKGIPEANIKPPKIIWGFQASNGQRYLVIPPSPLHILRHEEGYIYVQSFTVLEKAIEWEESGDRKIAAAPCETWVGFLDSNGTRTVASATPFLPLHPKIRHLPYCRFSPPNGQERSGPVYLSTSPSQPSLGNTQCAAPVQGPHQD